MTRDRVYLVHILECIARVERYATVGKSGFFADTQVQDAILRNLHTLAESTIRLSDTLKARHQEVEWRNIAGFRNVVVHDYLGVDLDQVWAVVERDLPGLKSQLAAILGELEGAP